MIDIGFPIAQRGIVKQDETGIRGSHETVPDRGFASMINSLLQCDFLRRIFSSPDKIGRECSKRDNPW
jgi:hypothetical protein